MGLFHLICCLRSGVQEYLYGQLVNCERALMLLPMLVLKFAKSVQQEESTGSED